MRGKRGLQRNLYVGGGQNEGDYVLGAGPRLPVTSAAK